MGSAAAKKQEKRERDFLKQLWSTATIGTAPFRENRLEEIDEETVLSAGTDYKK